MTTYSKAFDRIKGIFGLGLSLASVGFKLKNEGSYLGVMWYLLNPLALFVIILFISSSAFSNISIKDYPLYLLTGIIINNFFSKLIGVSFSAISKNAGLLKNIRFDYDSLVVSEILQILFSHFFEILILAGFMLYFHVSLLGLVGYAVVLFFFVLFLSGIVFLFATTGLYVSDMSNIWAIASQLLFFITPTFHILKQGTLLYTINRFNPLYYFLEVFRDVTLYRIIPPLYMILFIILVSTVLFVIGYLHFERKKKYFAELT